MPDITPMPAGSLKQAISAQFASRPTLRQVLGKAALATLTKAYPALAIELPELDSADVFTVTQAAGEDHVELVAIVDKLLEAFVRGEPLAFDQNNRLSMQPPSGAVTDIVDDSPLQTLNIDLSTLNGAFDECLAGLVQAFQQAQADYWNALDLTAPDSNGVSRHRWMSQALKIALAGSQSLAALDEDERSLVYELLQGLAQGPTLYALEVRLQDKAATLTHLRADLLLVAERETRSVVLWCRVDGHVSAFSSLEAFAGQLRDELAAQYRFDSLTWNRYALEGDAFLRQSGLLLNSMLGEFKRLRLASIATVAQLETVFAALSDPAFYFPDTDYFQQHGAAPQLPDWLAQASREDRFEYHAALLDLAVAQVKAGGHTALDDIEDMHTYAAQRLREQLLADYPTEANYFPDDLLLSVSVPDGLADKELPVTLKALGQMTLTELAIGHLDALQGGVVTAISHRDNQLIMPWMNSLYVTRLIGTVDIGASYPAYLLEKLDDPLQQGQRIERFASQWRLRLLFDALRAKIEKRLSDDAWQALAEFCRSQRDLKSNIDVAPLAFKCEPSAESPDSATCMFVLSLKDPGTVLLYRPLYEGEALLQYTDQQALMAALSQAGALQDSVLEWLPATAYRVYANGGFIEPHLRRVIFDTSIWPEPVDPVTLWLRPWLADIDTQMFKSRRAAMLELAERQTVSNAEHRWGVVKQGAWLLFNLVAPALPGPAMTLVWAAIGIASVLADVGTLQHASDKAVRAQATVDLLSNLAMVLVHGRLEQAPVEPQPASAEPFGFRFPEPRWGGDGIPLPVTSGPVHPRAALEERPALVTLDSGWGPKPDALAQALRPLASEVDLAEATYANGLYLKDERWYVELHGLRLQVMHEGDRRRIVGPGGEPGPYLFDDGGWRVRTSGFAWGGGPKAAGRSSQARFDRMLAKFNEETLANTPVEQRCNEASLEEHRLALEVTALEAASAKARDNVEQRLTDEQVDRLVEGYARKIEAKTVERLAATRRYLEILETLMQHDMDFAERCTTMIDMLRSRGVTSRIGIDSLVASRDSFREAVVRNAWLSYTRLFPLVGYDAVRAAANALRGRLVQDVQAEYATYRQVLASSSQVQQRLVDMSLRLDHYLPLLAEDWEVFPIGGSQTEAITIRALIDQRQIPTVDVQFQQLMYLAELAVHVDGADPDRRIALYRRSMIKRSLRAAAYNHGDVLTANLSAVDRLELLQATWDEYTATLINCIDIAREGGSRIDGGLLNRYVELLKMLKHSAGELLVEASTELDSGAPALRKPYKVFADQRYVARTSGGHLVIGAEVQTASGRRLEVRSPMDQSLLHAFEWRDGGWQELVDPAVQQVAPEFAQSSDEHLRAAAVLADNAVVQLRAAEYVKEDVGAGQLRQLIDGHVANLQGCANKLVDDQGPLAKLVRQRLEEWSQQREALLAELYSKTHYPEADALLFLHKAGLLKIKYAPPRKVLADNSAMDEYIIERLSAAGASKGKPIWVAHFHFAGQADPADAFTNGHLKTWAQRRFGASEARLLASRGERIHRGRLSLEQVRGIIPFN
ncbi:hypothetical protein [Pseudomonas farsensis]|uniref:Uncharacterized protein n=1 Tax=Pseudomonas farsensis TaxID=2745492 RepID=A0ABU8QV38_9PSED